MQRLLLIYLAALIALSCGKDPTKPQLVDSIYFARGFFAGDVSEDGTQIITSAIPSPNWLAGRPVLFTPDQIKQYPQSLLASEEGISGDEDYGRNKVEFAFSDPIIKTADIVWIKGSISARVAYITTVMGNYSIWISDSNGDNVAELYNSSTEISYLSCSSDGKSLLFLKQDNISNSISRLEVDGTTEEEIILNASDWGDVQSVACSPTGDTVIFSMKLGEEVGVYRMSLEGGDPDKVIDFDKPPIRIDGLAESHDGYQLALGMHYTEETHPNSLYLYDLSSGKLEIAIQSETGEAEIFEPESDYRIFRQMRIASWDRPTWFPDGRSMFVSCYNLYYVEVIGTSGNVVLGGKIFYRYRWESALVELR